MALNFIYTHTHTHTHEYDRQGEMPVMCYGKKDMAQNTMYDSFMKNREHNLLIHICIQTKLLMRKGLWQFHFL